MKLISKKLGNVGIRVPAVLFPKSSVDLTKWAVIACDQYTSNVDYWKRVSDMVGNAPSTLKLMLPEIYLDSSELPKKLKKITSEMKKYLRYSLLSQLEEGMIYIERNTSYGHLRKGLLVCIDLDRYDFSPDSLSLIRPTEKTIIERIPARVKIRENAVIELPHVMLLIDDPGKTVIEPLAAMKNSKKKLYSFDLMQDGGHLEGYLIKNIQDLEQVSKSLHALIEKSFYQEKYSTDRQPLLFAVGDGNHSLAAAKTHWENIKNNLTGDMLSTHPAKYAMVEIVNIHDSQVTFEPIHRVLFNTELTHFLSYIKNVHAQVSIMSSIDELEENVFLHAFDREKHCFGLISGEKYLYVEITHLTSHTACGTVQHLIDDFLKVNKATIDFIHDLKSLLELSSDTTLGFLLPPIDKSCFFKTVIEEGTLPRKTFSMGHGDEKRFYLETRKITL